MSVVVKEWTIIFIFPSELKVLFGSKRNPLAICLSRIQLMYERQKWILKCSTPGEAEVPISFQTEKGMINFELISSVIFECMNFFVFSSNKRSMIGETKGNLIEVNGRSTQQLRGV